MEPGSFPHIDYEKCSGCGTCSAVCSYKALILYGKPMNADEIFDAVYRDKMFYDTSGGGVTVSGGEALLQPQLVRDLFSKCCNAGIHTCIETSGYTNEANLRQVLLLTDYVLYDLKIMDPEKHRQYTGKSNDSILSNAKMIAQSGIATLFRMPLIPGINDDLQNITDTAAFLHGLGDNTLRIELMPYHRLGKGKYDSLDRPFMMADIPAPEPDHVATVKKAFEDNGIKCSVSR